MALIGVGKEEFEGLRSEVLGRLSSLEKNTSQRIVALEEEVKRKATDSESEAKLAAEGARAAEQQVNDLGGRIRAAVQEIDNYKSAAGAEALAIKEQRESLEAENKALLSAIDQLKESFDAISGEKKTVDAAIADSYAKLAELEKTLARTESLNVLANNIASASEKADSLLKDLSSLQDASIKKSKSIEEIHQNVFGYEITSQDGTSQKVKGLVSELEVAFGEVKSRVDGLEAEIESLVDETVDKYEEGLSSQKVQFDELIKDASARVDDVDNELKALLPGSMAAGLSAAYESKKDEEVLSQTMYSRYFSYAISAMIVVSLIPFSIDAYLLVFKAKDIVDVVRETPNLIASILPLYFPILWFAYSANKKLNLSKRLIEEYTHKAVLGRTFSGLSNQIESLPKEVIVKEELRTRLLFNMLQVSSENPGKLITDYNKTDHPLMDALENSAKLSESVAALAKLPGFATLAEKLAAKSVKIIDDQTKKVEEGLAIQDELEAKPDSEKRA